MTHTITKLPLYTVPVVTLSLLPGISFGSQPREGRNILFIAVDDLKPLLGAYGDPRAVTPNIDRLARRGTLFTHAYCQQAVSGPSRASLLTGLCPDRTGVWDLKTLIRSVHPDATTLPQHLRNNGYETYGIGKIYDPRSVDKMQDQASWSLPYASFEAYYNPEYDQPLYSYYQLPETRESMIRLEKELLAQGLKPAAARNAVLEKIKPSTECVDLPDDAYPDGAIANGAVEFIEHCDKSKRYFWAVGFKRPHLPFCAPKKYWDLYDRAEIPLATFRRKAQDSPQLAYHNCGELVSYTDIPALITFSDIDNAILDDDKARELIHGYYAAVSYVDAQVGRLLDALERSGQLDNTVIVFWGDHGWHLGDHGLWNKHTNFEQATHAPLIICDPSLEPSTVTTPVEFLDIFPTLCEAVSIAAPEHLDGKSLLGLMRGAEPSANTYAASQFPRGKVMGYTLRNERYRYTVWVDWKNRTTDPETIVAEELYDYKKDPDETRNLVKDKSYAAALQQMRACWNDYKNKRINK